MICYDAFPHFAASVPVVLELTVTVPSPSEDVQRKVGLVCSAGAQRLQEEPERGWERIVSRFRSCGKRQLPEHGG